MQEFYSELYKVNKEQKALWNGHFGGDYERLNVGSENRVFAFKRTSGESSVVTIVNLDSVKVNFNIEDTFGSEYASIFSREVLSDQYKQKLQLPAFGYQIFVKE